MIRLRFFSSKPPGIVARLARLNSFYDAKECESLIGDVSLLADMGTIKRQDAIELLMELGSNLALKQEAIPVSMWVTMLQIMDWKDTEKIKSVRSKFSVEIIKKNRKTLLESVKNLLSNSPKNSNRLILALLSFSDDKDTDIIDEILDMPWKKSLQVWRKILDKYYASHKQTAEKMSSLLYQMAIVEKIDCTKMKDERHFKAYGILLKLTYLKAQFNSLVPSEHIYGNEFYDCLILSLIAVKNYNCAYSTALYLLHTPDMPLPSSFVLGHAIRQLFYSGHETMANDLILRGVDAHIHLPKEKMKSDYTTIPKKMPLNLHLFYQILDGILSVKELRRTGHKIIENASIYGFDRAKVKEYFSRGDIFLKTWNTGVKASNHVSTYLRSSSKDNTFRVIRKLAKENNFELAVKVADVVIERQKGNASCVFFAMLVSSRVFPRRFKTLESMITNLLKNDQAIYPDLFNAWIKYLLIRGDFAKARKVFYEMQELVKPDLYTYMSFVSSEFRRKRPDLARFWFEESIQNGIPATTVGLSIMATGYLKLGSLDMALEYYGKMIGYNFKNRASVPVQDSQFIDNQSIEFFTRYLWKDRMYKDLCLVISKTALTSKFEHSYQTWLMVATYLLKRGNFCAITLTGTSNDIPTMNLALTNIGLNVLFNSEIVNGVLKYLRRQALGEPGGEGMALRYFKNCFILLQNRSLLERVFGSTHSFVIEQYLKLILLEMLRSVKDIPAFSFAEHYGFKLLTSEIPDNFKMDAYVETMLLNLPKEVGLASQSYSMDHIPRTPSDGRNVMKISSMNSLAEKPKPMVIRPTNFSSQLYYIAKNHGKDAAENFFEEECGNREVDMVVISNVVRHRLRPKYLDTVPNIFQYLEAEQLNPTPEFYALLYQSNYEEINDRDLIFKKLESAVGEKEAYVLIISAFCKAGNMDLADYFLQVFLKKGYTPPNDRFFFMLMTGYVTSGQFENSLYFLERLIGYDLNNYSRLPGNPLPSSNMADTDKYHNGLKFSFIKSVISKSIYPEPTAHMEKVVHFLTLYARTERQISVDLIPKIVSFSISNNSCWGLNLLYMLSNPPLETLKDAGTLLYTKSRNFEYFPELADSILKVIKTKVGDSQSSGKSIAQVCFEVLFSCDHNPSKLYLELILYTAVCFDFEVESNLGQILGEESAMNFLEFLKNSGLFAKEKFDLPKIPTPKTFKSILDETLPFAGPLVNLFQPELFPVSSGEEIVKKSFKERYAEALLCGGDADLDGLCGEYPDLEEEIRALAPNYFKFNK